MIPYNSVICHYNSLHILFQNSSEVAVNHYFDRNQSPPLRNISPSIDDMSSWPNYNLHMNDYLGHNANQSSDGYSQQTQAMNHDDFEDVGMFNHISSSADSGDGLSPVLAFTE